MKLVIGSQLGFPIQGKELNHIVPYMVILSKIWCLQIIYLSEYITLLILIIFLIIDNIPPSLI